MMKRFGIDSAVFSLKAYIAAMMAVYFSIQIGLERPYWAFLTSYIVAQPLAGAVLSKALFRVIGTFVGAAASVVMVPGLVNSPVLLVGAIGLWLALCVFVSLLDRTPRAYAFVLAGYTAVLIVLPSVDTPGAIFETASLRLQEITVGILCGSLVHGLVLPQSISSFLLRRVSTILLDAERWSSDSLQPNPDPSVDAERRRLALDITELHQLSIHLPFETARVAPRIRTVRALQDQLSLIMPLGAAVTDRIEQLDVEAAIPDDVHSLLDDARDWLRNLDRLEAAEREEQARQLQARCTELEPVVSTDSSWHDLMLLSLVSRLSTLIRAHRDCRDLSEQLSSLDRRPVSARAAELLEGRRGRELHYDVGGAARGAIGAFITIAVGSALWIGSGWTEAYAGVMLAGVFSALFSAAPDPLAPLRAFFLGTLIAIVIGAIYGYAILPALHGFPEFAAALAPALLLLGALMSSPRYGGFALPMLLGLGSPLLIAPTYVSRFGSYVDGALAQLVGIVFAITMIRLLQSSGLEAAIRRTIRAGWKDIAERSNLMAPADFQGWINRMLDRIALLAPRLAMSGKSPGSPLYDALRDLRTGVAIGELRDLRLAMTAEKSAPVTKVLRDVGEYYRKLEPEREKPAAPALLADIDRALKEVLGDENPRFVRSGALALISLRRNLFPEAEPMKETPA
ncbi:FUSC family protein [Novosphingobium sp. KN65.2]|uniref:FUSC family protein n=1 Tax=Novosphingobium sp. KN65.2 TaxID=1478134 RepID=UPI0006D5B73A|nr:FUSC family protein [Novosphingobium sp. KN65.2]